MATGRDKGMTLIVKTVTRLTLGFILLYGIYIALNGHTGPGGGFAGGVIVALSFVHIMLAYGKEVALNRFRTAILRLFVSLGALLFLIVVVSAFRGGCVPFNIASLGRIPCALFNAKFTLPLCEMAVVGCGFYTIFVALVLVSKRDKDAE